MYIPVVWNSTGLLDLDVRSFSAQRKQPPEIAYVRFVFGHVNNDLWEWGKPKKVSARLPILKTEMPHGARAFC